MSSRSGSKWSVVRSLIVGLTGGWLAAVQAGADPCPAPCPSGKIPLGIAAPVSGQAQAQAFGRQITKAAEVSVRELNAAGGVMGLPVDLVVADDRCEPGAAISAANRQVEHEKLGFVIGPACPPAAMATAPIYARAGVVQSLPTMPVTALGTMRPSPSNAYSVMATDEQEAQALGDYLAREQAGKTLAVVYSDAFYKRGIVQTMKDALPPDTRASARFEPLLDSTGIYERLADKLKREGFRFRAFFSGSPSLKREDPTTLEPSATAGYADRYFLLKGKVDAWFDAHAADLGGKGSKLYDALRANYTIEPAGTDHMHDMCWLPGAKKDAPFTHENMRAALGSLPTVFQAGP